MILILILHMMCQPSHDVSEWHCHCLFFFLLCLSALSVCSVLFFGPGIFTVGIVTDVDAVIQILEPWDFVEYLFFFEGIGNKL